MSESNLYRICLFLVLHFVQTSGHFSAAGYSGKRCWQNVGSNTPQATMTNDRTALFGTLGKQGGGGYLCRDRAAAVWGL